MSGADQTFAAVSAVEALILEQFRTEPFHNLHLIHGQWLQALWPGGTCSDKTLSFVAAGKREGFDVFLHSGYIGGREIHRLARVQIAGRRFFADVGNGWPALKLYPADRETVYHCFGMRFRTEITGRRVNVFLEKKGKESLQLEIDVRGRPESEIRADIEKRFRSGFVYPFSHSLRFSQVVGSRFLFLRGDQLEIYSNSGFECLEGIDDARLPTVLSQYFGYDVQPFLRGDRIGHREGGARESTKNTVEDAPRTVLNATSGRRTPKNQGKRRRCHGQFS